jgi:broad specificity phosphatase PhoE
MLKRIIYTRHPECLHNVDHEHALRSGVANRKSPLTTVGELQRDITAEYLRREFPSIDAVVCSTHTRTHAIPVAAGFESVLSENSLLDERNMGVWHTHLRADVLKMYPGEEDRRLLCV